MASHTATLTATLIDEVSKPARSVETALKQAEAQVKSIAAAMGGSGVAASDKLIASLAKLKASKADIDAVSAAWKSYATAQGLAASSSEWTTAQAAAVKAWETSTVASVRAVIAERRAEAVTYAQVAAEEKAILARQATEQAALMRSRQAQALATREMWLGGGGNAMLAKQFGAMSVGGGMIAGVKDAIAAGASLQTAAAQLRAAGLDAAEATAAQTQSLALSAKFFNVSQTEAMEQYRELRSVLQKREETPGVLPAAVQAYSVMKSLGLPTGGMASFYKSAETYGLTKDPEKFRKYLDAFIKMQEEAHGTIDPETILAFTQQAKASAQVLSQRFIDTTMLLLAQETGSRGGSGLSGLLKIAAGNVTGKEAAEWKRLGFLSDRDVLYSKKGEVQGLKPGHHIKGWEELISDPDLFMWNKLMPALKKAGITDKVDIIAETAALFGEQRAASVAAVLLNQEEQFKAHTERLAAAAGIGGWRDLLDTAAGSFAGLKTQLKDFLGVASSPLMAPAGHALGWLADRLGSLSVSLAAWEKANPDFAPWASGGAVAAGAGLGGWALWKGFSGFTGGFGLSSSAVALDASAAELSAAALALRGGAAAEAAAATEMGVAARGGILGAGLLGRLLGAGALTGLNLWNAPSTNKDVADQVNAFNSWLNATTVGKALNDFMGGRKTPEFAGGFMPPHRPYSPTPVRPAAPVLEPERFPGGVAPTGAVIDKARELGRAASADAAISVDTSALDAAIDKALVLRGVLGDLFASAAPSGLFLPPLAPTLRSNFTASGVNGE